MTVEVGELMQMVKHSKYMIFHSIFDPIQNKFDNKEEIYY